MIRVSRFLATAAVIALVVNDHILKQAYPGWLTGKLSDVAGVTWGAMQWPHRALRALAHGRELPGLARVVLVRDVTDVLAVPFVIVAYLAAARRRRGQPFFFAKSFMNEASVSTQPSSTAL